MPDSYHIILTREALSDLEEIADYIRVESPQAAALVAEKILDAIDSVASMPERFKRVGKSQKRGSPVHAMIVRPFIVYYRIEQSSRALHILTVTHGASRQPRHFA